MPENLLSHNKRLNPPSRKSCSFAVMNSKIGVDPVMFAIFIIITVIACSIGLYWRITWVIPVGILLAAVLSSCVRVASQWEKAVVLRLGKYQGLAGPGLFFVVPIIDSIADWVDQRIRITSFTAEQTLTKDTVPVDVDAVLFWVVWDPEKAVLEVADYRNAVAWAAQTALRDLIGKTLLAEMLVGRLLLDEELRKLIDERTTPWGISVQSVEIRNVIIPSDLQEAMSREAQAERERRARILLGTAETEIAKKFAEAAKSYKEDPVALQLRAMNILYEGLKETGSIVVVPSSIADSLHGISDSLNLDVLKQMKMKTKYNNSEHPLPDEVEKEKIEIPL
jgi:regulator of protease activity HflC (stomatin/prohibitin superfamily)